MKRPADLVVLARRAAKALGLLALLGSPALAGDRASIDFIGFSPDARYFAFEEFGIQDGSGFAYSSVYVIDLTTDAWVEGTPIRARADDETTSLLSIRAEANNEALRLVAENEIFVPAEIAAMIGDGVREEDPTRLAFSFPFPGWGPEPQDYLVSLSSFPSTSPEDCAAYFGAEPLGYELRLMSGDIDVLLHRDEGLLPQSRGCPSDYRLYAVLVPGPGATGSAGVAIVSSYPGGFEGPDRRFLAVPIAF